MLPANIRDAILFLALLGVWLLMPPMLEIFNQPGRFLGMPPIVVYVFGVWVGLIAMSAWLTRRAARALDHPDPASRRRDGSDDPPAEAG